MLPYNCLLAAFMLSGEFLWTAVNSSATFLVALGEVEPLKGLLIV